MPLNDVYQAQVRLLMRLIPIVSQEHRFALKGGTAINLFIRDLPRLSVDIDLMYLPRHGRPQALKGIHAAMSRIKTQIEGEIAGAHVATTQREGAILRLIVSAGGTQVKIEVSPVLRGVVAEPEIKAVSEAVESKFGFAETNVVSFEDLYAGKLVAALDRQHPRDLFDVRDLLANEGLTEGLREAFVVYLLSHNRPMWEVLSGRRKDIEGEFINSFDGMTDEPVTIDELSKTQDRLIAELIGDMPERHRSFLIGFENGNPNWTQLAFAEVKDLPAILWRQHNLDSLRPEVRSRLVAALKEVLNTSA